MTDSHMGAEQAWLSPSAALNRLQLDDDELKNEAVAILGTAEHVQQRHGVAIGSFSSYNHGESSSQVITDQIDLFPRIVAPRGETRLSLESVRLSGVLDMETKNQSGSARKKPGGKPEGRACVSVGKPA